MNLPQSTTSASNSFNSLSLGPSQTEFFETDYGPMPRFPVLPPRAYSAQKMTSPASEMSRDNTACFDKRFQSSAASSSFHRQAPFPNSQRAPPRMQSTGYAEIPETPLSFDRSSSPQVEILTAPSFHAGSSRNPGALSAAGTQFTNNRDSIRLPLDLGDFPLR